MYVCVRMGVCAMLFYSRETGSLIIVKTHLPPNS